MAFKFTSSDCNSAANEMMNSSQNIGSMFDDLGRVINSVAGNYQSDASNQITEAFNKAKGKLPAFQDAVRDCSKYLTETVAPAYEKLEATAKAKVGA